MREAVVLTYVAAALVAAAPWVPAFENVLFRNISEGSRDTTLSFADIARGSRDVAALGSPPPWIPGDEFRQWHAMFVASETKRIDGRPECVGAVAMAAAAVGLALVRRTRHAWVPASVLAGASTWTWFRLRADLLDSVGWLPGGLESIRIWGWILPWPWLLLGAAVILLAAATWRARRASPRPSPVDTGVFE